LDFKLHSIMNRASGSLRIRAKYLNESSFFL
jgi:hypothetical protein